MPCGVFSFRIEIDKCIHIPTAQAGKGFTMQETDYTAQWRDLRKRIGTFLACWLGGHPSPT